MTASPLSELSRAVDLRVLARSDQPLVGEAALNTFERLCADLPAWPGEGQAPAVRWRAQVEWRQRTPQAVGLAGAHDEQQLWLHLTVDAAVPQTCQRCLQPYAEAVAVDRWFRFVKDETVALAEDDEAEEDLLVLEPRFDLAALVEDELLMALPLVPMHDTCPEPLAPKVDPADETVTPQRPNPFAALAALKARSRDGETGA